VITATPERTTILLRQARKEGVPRKIHTGPGILEVKPGPVKYLWEE
jgi:hypothetical protein